jgi:hypothetical protein
MRSQCSNTKYQMEGSFRQIFPDVYCKFQIVFRKLQTTLSDEQFDIYK